MKRKTLVMTEGAICIALSIALSYLEIEIGPQGGSFGFAMIPLILYAVHIGGVGWGVLAGFAFGTLKFFLTEGFAITWQSMLLDYSVAYAAVGLAGIFRGRSFWGYAVGALIGCIARFIIHFISGVTIYSVYMQDVYLGFEGLNMWTYSLLYNGFYMLFSTIAAIVLAPAIGIALEKSKLGSRSLEE